METNHDENHPSTVPETVQPIPPRRSRRLRWPAWKILTVAVVAVVVFMALKSRRASANLQPVSTALLQVAVTRVTRQDLSQAQVFEAEFRPYQEIDLHAKVAGFVQSINVDIGDQVKAGTLLATLEVPELKEDIQRAEAQEVRDEKEIARAEAAYEDTHLSFTRLSAVNQSHPNLVAQQDLDTAHAKDAATDAALATARQEVEVSKAEVNKLKAMLDYCKITAPFGGVITKRYADEGALVQGGAASSAGAMPLVQLSQNDRLRLDFPVSVSYVERVQVGDPVSIRIPATGRVLAGKISRFTRKVNTDTRTMEAEVDVTNTDLSLTPGIYATATLTLDHREQVLAVPVEAVAGHKSPTVFVLNKNEEIEERPVTVGLETADKLEITAGLAENDLVIIGSRAQMRAGQKVQPKIVELGEAQSP